MPSFLTRFGKYTDVFLAGGIVSVIALLIVPLPPELLAILQVLNLGAALTILLVAIYTQEPLEFSVLPALLLVTTLMRLGLNISSTRLILLQAQAGPVIDAFGSFVIGGSFVVGIVVFLILTVIQFVVITNGAGRVAEVAARFTLDAMPGKQMAIDADLNAGVIDQTTAQQRRRKIQQEADFYGAMDGASKFVKGDATAGIIIILINIIGGIIIGVVQNNLDIMTAINRYSLLTIGDGLVTQIPALLISTATGIVVTRAESDKSSNLGRDIINQLSFQPRAMGTAAALIGLIGLIPGMPFLPFVGIGASGVVGAYYLNRNKQKEAAAEAAAPAQAGAQNDDSAESVMKLLDVDAMELAVGYGLISLVDKNSGANFLTRVSLIRRQIAQELGIITPTIRIHDDVSLDPNTYVIKIRGVAVAEGKLFVSQYLAMNSGLAEEEIDGIPTVEPTFGLPAIWISSAMKEIAEAAKYTVVDAPSVLATHLTEVIKVNAWSLLTKQDTHQLMDHVKASHPALVDDLVPAILSLGEVQAVLQFLLRERVCIRDLPAILEAIGAAARTNKDVDILAERARYALARAICVQYQESDKGLYVITLPNDTEIALAHSVERTDQGPMLTIESSFMQRLLEGIASAIEKSAMEGHQPVIMVSMRVRMALRRLLERHLPTQAVLSYEEASVFPNVKSAGVVQLSPQPLAAMS